MVLDTLVNLGSLNKELEESDFEVKGFKIFTPSLLNPAVQGVSGLVTTLVHAGLDIAVLEDSKDRIFYIVEKKNN